MQSTFSQNADSLNITLSGDLIGGADAMKFGVELRDALAANKVERVTVDASSVGFVNSSGLGMLIAARQASLEHSAEFELKNPGEQLMGLLQITKLSDIMGVA